MSLQHYGIDPARLPQQPFLPIVVPDGPIFLDTEACLCALQPLPGVGSLAGDGWRFERDEAVWQCIGNQTQDVYNVTTSKWFKTVHGKGRVDLPMNDASNGPDTDEELTWDLRSRSLKPLMDEKKLTVYDRDCTGKNQTTFSTSFYRATQELERDQLPWDATPCWRLGAMPLQLQGVDSWLKDGCKEGFLCKFHL